MDFEAHSSCLRAIAIIARACRLCASVEAGSTEYRRSAEGAERSLGRADQHYRTMRDGHAAHERAVRLVETAVVEARAGVRVLQEGLADPDTLDRIGAKIERAVARAQLPSQRFSSATPPPDLDPGSKQD